MIFDFTVNSDANYVLIDIKFINDTMMIVLLLSNNLRKYFIVVFIFLS